MSAKRIKSLGYWYAGDLYIWPLFGHTFIAFGHGCPARILHSKGVLRQSWPLEGKSSCV